MSPKRRLRPVILALALVACAMAVMSAPPTAAASPMLWLVKSGTAATIADSIPQGTATYGLDLRADTGGNAVSGLQYYLQTSPSAAVQYGGTPLTMLNNPFTSSDLQHQPSAGAPVQSGVTGTTVLLASGADYSAFPNNALATYQFNTGLILRPLSTLTPSGPERLSQSILILTRVAIVTRSGPDAGAPALVTRVRDAGGVRGAAPGAAGPRRGAAEDDTAEGGRRLRRWRW